MEKVNKSEPITIFQAFHVIIKRNKKPFTLFTNERAILCHGIVLGLGNVFKYVNCNSSTSIKEVQINK